MKKPKKQPIHWPQPEFTGSDAEKQAQYTQWRAKWFTLTQGRKILTDKQNKKGRPK